MPSPSSNTASLDLQLPGPLDVPASLEVVSRWGDDLLERWDGAVFLRALHTGQKAFACTMASIGTLDRPAVRIQVDDPINVLPAATAARQSFLFAPPDFAGLVERDPVIARLNALYPGRRPVRQLDLLTALVRAISAQQVNLTWAATTRRRLAERFGERLSVGGAAVFRLDAVRLASAGVSDVRELQFTTRKAEYIIGVAREIAEGQLRLEDLQAMSDEEVITRLLAIRGIGLWTAEWILVRVLGRPRVVAGDLGVRKAVGLAYLDESLPPEWDVRRATNHWGASAAIAQLLLLEGLVHRSLQSPTP